MILSEKLVVVDQVFLSMVQKTRFSLKDHLEDRLVATTSSLVPLGERVAISVHYEDQTILL